MPTFWDLAGDDVLIVLIGRLIRVIEDAILGVLGRSMWVLCVRRWWHAELGMVRRARAIGYLEAWMRWMNVRID